MFRVVQTDQTRNCEAESSSILENFKMSTERQHSSGKSIDSRNTIMRHVSPPELSSSINVYGTESDFLPDSKQEIEEFSSFDISNEDINDSRRKKNYDDCFDVSELSDRVEAETDSPSLTANPNTAAMSTPNSYKSSTLDYSQEKIEFYDLCSDSLKSKSKNLEEDKKRSSTMSSDTFETPRSIDTRTSTIVSNTQADIFKIVDHELLMSSARIKQLSNSDTSVPKSKTHKKRLSRQSDMDTSIDKNPDPDSLVATYSVDSLMSKISLNDTESAVSRNIPNLVPSSNELVDLQNQLTSCKIQIKLQNDLLRDKIFQSFGENTTKQELSDQLQRQIFNSLNSSKYKIQLNKLNNDYHELQLKYKKILQKNIELDNSLEMLQDQYADQSNNQCEWQNKINDLILKIKNTLNLQSSTKFNHFEDILDNLSNIIELIVSEIIKSRETIDAQTEQLQESQRYKNELLNKIRVKDETGMNIRKELEDSVDKYEHAFSKMKSQITSYQNAIESEQLKLSALNDKNESLQIAFHELEEKYTAELKIKHVQAQDNIKSEYMRVEQLTSSMASYHSVLLNLLTKIIDPSSAGDIISACNNLTGNVKYDEVIKIFSVAHNYEIDSISIILENYDALMEKKLTRDIQSKTISELHGEITFLAQKISDLEAAKDSGTIRIQELETENAKLKEIVNQRLDKTDKLKELRLDDLNKKWKTAEEALSQTEQGAKLKVFELEKEVKILQTKLDQSGVI